MSRLKMLESALCSLAVLSGSVVANAQFALDWFTMDGCGGTSTGGIYSVSGTIGQPDAGATMSGGNYALNGGFWSLLSVLQTPGAPRLSIGLTTTNTAVISWPRASTSFALQQNSDLSTSNWTSPAQSVTNNGVVDYIVVEPPTGTLFYRLFKP